MGDRDRQHRGRIGTAHQPIPRLRGNPKATSRTPCVDQRSQRVVRLMPKAFLAPIFAVVSLLVPAGSVHRAEAYRFYSTREPGTVGAASDALRWSASRWGPGDTLVWRVADTPDWERHGWPSIDVVLRVVREALAVWSSVSTADISWRLAGVGTFDRHRDSEFVYIVPDTPVARGEFRVQDDEIVGCNVRLGSRTPYDSEDEFVLRAIGLVVHELGHCLGLAHAGATPGERALLFGQYDPTQSEYSYHGTLSTPVPARSPIMSYGSSFRVCPWASCPEEPNPFSDILSHDDRVGASLLRPADGWTWGSISGRVLLDGRPLKYVHILAFGEGTEFGLPRAVGTFSGPEGTFRIEGLSPGVYSLWLSPLLMHSAHPLLVARGAPFDIADSWLPVPVDVAAGSTSTGIEIHALQERDCHVPAPCKRLDPSGLR